VCVYVCVLACVLSLLLTIRPKLLLLLLLPFAFDYPLADYLACGLSVYNHKLLMIDEECGGKNVIRDMASSDRKISSKQKSGYFVLIRVRSANYALL
jgi:hypothetical protein